MISRNVVFFVLMFSNVLSCGTTSDTQTVNEEPKIFVTQLSPNSPERRPGGVDKIVLHNTESTYDSAVKTFLTPNKTSAHIIVDLGGQVTRMVPDGLSAQHAGPLVNSFSVGMEIVNQSKSYGGGLTSLQEPVVVAWVRYWMKKYNIPATQVLMHQMTPGNNTDCAQFIWKDVPTFLQWRKDNLETPAKQQETSKPKLSN